MMSYSVAMCIYNGEKYIVDQLKSIIEQTILPSEIIICDDCSTDRSALLANQILSECNIRYKYFYNESKKGVANNFLLAIQQCSNEYIFTSDQDDIWSKNKAEVVLKEFERHHEAMLIFSNGELINSSNKSLNCSIWDSVGITKTMIQEEKWFEYMLPKHIVTGATMAIRKSLINGIDTIPDGYLHDEWLAMKASILDAVVACPNKLIYYRQHGDNVVGMKKYSLMDKIIKWYRHIYNLPDIRITRVERYKFFKTSFFDILSQDKMNHLNKCINFWSESCELTNENKFKSIKWIFLNLKQNNYDLYYNGRSGAIRDFLGLLIR